MKDGDEDVVQVVIDVAEGTQAVAQGWPDGRRRIFLVDRGLIYDVWSGVCLNWVELCPGVAGLDEQLARAARLVERVLKLS